jgi:hypothetical protein
LTGHESEPDGWSMAAIQEDADADPVKGRREVPSSVRPPAAALEGHEETLALINDEISASLERQNNMAVRVDTKAIFLAGFVAAAAQFLATQRHLPAFFAGIAFAVYATAFALAISAIAVTKYQDLGPSTAAVLPVVTCG